ncbi:SoxY-related AACIE arm protein [Methylobacterium sp. NEAU 140]|uniref:SoxY-related AACIE arm protein n=1 Tax=Methylobacterium sp. NEAU 140 TaxID=3064945 RepID=UPI00273764B8|nr:SoxY-related AACIE arm protein [Methylobacterium sp. NEAU 140]MDP4024959.1 SoxY-related AACIE arm protein [Methylobacterium sp. NEAU 140]
MREKQPDRRRVLAGTAGLALAVTLRPAVGASLPRTETTEDAIRRFAGSARIRPGRVALDLPPLVENGNTVPLGVTVESPMTPDDHVRRIGVFNERNPQPNVVTVHLRPGAGRAQVATRIRLADTQRITAIAEMSDGTYWSGSADAIVTLAACLEG